MNHCIDTMNHCIDTCWYVSIHSFTECMFWSWHGPVSIHEVWYRYRGLCIDTSTCCIDTNGDISNFCRVGALYRYMRTMYRYIQVKLWNFSYLLSPDTLDYTIWCHIFVFTFDMIPRPSLASLKYLFRWATLSPDDHRPLLRLCSRLLKISPDKIRCLQLPLFDRCWESATGQR